MYPSSLADAGTRRPALKRLEAVAEGQGLAAPRRRRGAPPASGPRGTRAGVVARNVGMRRPGTRRRPLRSPRVHSSTSRRRAVRRGGRPRRAARSSRLRLGQDGRSGSARRHRTSGSRRIVPRPEHGASTRTAVECRPERRRAARVGLDDADVWRARFRTVRDSNVEPSCRARPRRRSSRRPHRRRHLRRLAARRRARVEDPLAGVARRRTRRRAATLRPGRRTRRCAPAA